MKDNKKKLNIFVSILIILGFLGIIVGGGFLINKGVNDLNKNNETTSDNNQTDKPNTLEELEQELKVAKENINIKLDELTIEQDAKKIECDKLQQTETNIFLKKGLNSDEYYEASRKVSKCNEEETDIWKKKWDLEHDSPISNDDEIEALIVAKADIEKRIDEIKNPRPTFPSFTLKEFDWDKFKAVMEIIFGALIIIIPLVYIFVIYNKIVKSLNKVDNTFANIDVYLKKRWDLIPNILESVKGYSAYESNVLTDVVKLRQGNYNNLDINEKVSLNDEISINVSKILLLQEKYPDLKANNNYLDLSKQLSSIENEIATSRIQYNDAVMKYNNTIEIFPNNILVYFLGNQEMKMFGISSEEKENVKIKISE